MLLLVGLGVLAEGSTALAATTIHVTSTGDSGAGSLREAITLASSGDTIDFAIPNGTPGCSGAVCTITLTSNQLTIDKDLAIVGPGAALLTVKRSTADGTPSFRIFSIAISRAVGMSGLTISNGATFGSAEGAGILNQGALTLFDTTVSNNHANGGTQADRDGFGGGIFNTSHGSVTLVNSTVTNNSAYWLGGGIFNDGLVTITNSSLTYSALRLS
jgi:hypothetical protein